MHDAMPFRSMFFIWGFMQTADLQPVMNSFRISRSYLLLCKEMAQALVRRLSTDRYRNPANR